MTLIHRNQSLQPSLPRARLWHFLETLALLLEALRFALCVVLDRGSSGTSNLSSNKPENVERHD